MLARHRLIDLAPVDRFFGRRVANDKLVLDAATGELASVDQQRAVLGQLPLAALDRQLDQRCRRQIPVNAGQGFKTLCIQLVRGGALAHIDSP